MQAVPGPNGRRAVVIGSGFGGLAAAVRLGARGWNVTVLERHEQPGGRARVFRQDGFTFDAGPTVITAPFLFEELWQLAGKRMADHVDLRPVHPFYRIHFSDGTAFEYSGDAEKMRAEVARVSPGDVDGYERFVAMSERIFAVGFEKLAHVPFGSWQSMAKVVPAMVRLQSYRSVYSLVASFVKNDKLRQVLSFHPLLVGGNPFKTTSIYSLIPYLERKWGVHFPIGGTGSLVRGLVDLAEGQGRPSATGSPSIVSSWTRAASAGCGSRAARSSPRASSCRTRTPPTRTASSSRRSIARAGPTRSSRAHATR